MEYVIEMLNITKEFPGIKANDNITLQLKKGEIHALLGENGAGKSTLMSILFGLYQLDSGCIKIKGQLVKINNPNDANRFKIGMVHQHFKLVETFSVLDNIILGTEECKNGFLVKENARKQIMILSKQYNLNIDPDAIVKDITVGMLNGYRGKITLNNKDITNSSIRQRNLEGIAHIPEDRHKYGLVLDYNLAENMILKNYFTRDNQKWGFLRFDYIYKQAQILIKNYDVRSGQGVYSKVRELSGGNQQKAIIAREINSNCDLLIAVQPTRGLDIGAIEFIHEQLIQYRNNRHAVLLVSLELDEVMSISDRILVMHEGQIVGNLDPKKVNAEELGLYMSGSKRGVNDEK